MKFRKFFKYRHPSLLIRTQIAKANTRRLRIFAGIMFVVHLIHIFLFWIDKQNLQGAATAQWRLQIITLHSIMAFLDILFVFLLGLSQKNLRLTEWVIKTIAIAYLMFAIAIATVDQIVTTAITPYMVGSIGIAYLFLFTPRFSFILFFTGVVLFSMVIGLYQHSTEVQLSLKVNALTFGALAIGLNFVFYSARVRSLRQASLIRKQHDFLTRKNQALLDEAGNREQMFAIIGHDLRGPVGLSIEFLRQAEQADEAKAKHYRKVAISSLIDSYALLQNLVAMAQQPGLLSTKPLFAETRRVIEDVVHLYLPLAEKNLVAIEQTGMFPNLAFPAESLALVIRNLLQNAIKISPQGSKVIIEGDDYGPICSIKIIDQGPGLPADATQRFEQGQAITDTFGPKSGAGLGLTLVRDRLQRYKGSLVIEPNPDGGSVFILVFSKAKT